VLGDDAKQGYSRQEVRRVLHISEQRLRSWEKRDLIPTASSYAFNDLVALRTLLKLSQDRVSAERIRCALAALRRKLSGIENPLTELRIVTQGRRIVVQTGDSTMEPLSGQLLLDFNGADLSELENMVSFPQKQKEKEKEGPARNVRESEFWFQKGLELERTGAPIEQAMEAYSRAVELDPHSTGALVNLGTIHFHKRAWKEAEEYYRKALEADPSYVLAHFNLGNLFDEKGDHEQAIVHYQAALRIDPDHADAHYNLALLYQGLGQMKAVRHWKAYLKLDSSSEWAAIARQQLEKLRASSVVEGSRDKVGP
jgi:tetratricopeptide (TPR) repeat protein